VHSRNLNVPLFERGYEKDPALVAQHGIYEGTATHSHLFLWCCSRGDDLLDQYHFWISYDNKPSLL
jgi:hypothetical protein